MIGWEPDDAVIISSPMVSRAVSTNFLVLLSTESSSRPLLEMLSIGSSDADLRQMVTAAMSLILRRPLTTTGGQVSESSRSNMSVAMSARMSKGPDSGPSDAALDGELSKGTEGSYLFAFIDWRFASDDPR